jgi:hypothetical protein
MWHRPVCLQHLCVGTHQLTAPDGSAVKYSARTDKMKVALMAPVECLPSKLPSWAVTDVSGSCTNAGTRTNAIGNQPARTHTTLTPPTGNLFTTRSLSDGCRGDGDQGYNKSLRDFECCSISWHQTTVRVRHGASCSRAGEGRGGDPIWRGGVIVPPPYLSRRKRSATDCRQCC